VRGIFVRRCENCGLDPTEERLREEFAETRVLHLPMQSVLRVEEVERRGNPSIRDAASGEKVVTPFPLPARGGSGRAGSEPPRRDTTRPRQSRTPGLRLAESGPETAASGE
jgi:hypothetical protein